MLQHQIQLTKRKTIIEQTFLATAKIVLNVLRSCEISPTSLSEMSILSAAFIDDESEQKINKSNQVILISQKFKLHLD